MLVGIVSDSHDNVPMLKRAVEHFNAAGCGLVLHAGDFVAPFSIAVLEKLACPFKAVYGNNDGEKVGLKMKAAAVGGSVEEPPLTLEAGGRKFVVLHDCENWAAEAERFGVDVVVFGHTHALLIERPHGTRLPVGINPGECGGWLSGSCTAAVFDTETLDVRVVDLTLDPGKEIKS